MALAIGNGNYGKASANTVVESTSFACSGSNRILIAALMWRNYGAETYFSSIKWGGSGGTSLTPLGSTISEAARECHIRLAYLLNPAEGTTTLYGTLNTSAAVLAVGGVVLTGADVAGTPLGSLVSATGEDTTPTVNATSATGEIIVDAMICYDTSIITPGGGQTAVWSDINLGATGAGAMSTEAGAGTVTMSYTVDDDVWAIVAVPVKPAAGGGGSSIAAIANHYERLRG